ncbi:DUF932 domain-containing protein [Legionella sp. CNM-1927-20]|uniref:DUF932 domain-containing protein n=1 Tax=Legionella sp. CNM-1927-20 TaxID=3422221 RepID=UPI00403B09ED
MYTENGYEKTSDRYQPISTAMVVEKLIKEGFYPTKAYQTSTRTKEKKLFSKHMIRFRRYDLNYAESAYFPEIVLVNSHDGLSSYRLMAGLYRLVCSNGMVAGFEYDEVRVKHVGNVIDNVIEGTFNVVQCFDGLMNAVKTMQSIALGQDEKLYLAQKAHLLRFEGNAATAIAPEKLLRPRRYSGTGDDLFSVLNVIQENVIRGGISGLYRNEQGRLQGTRSREVRSIDQNIRLNRELWSAAEKLLPHVA